MAAGGISLVAKRPSPGHIEDIGRILPNGTRIYLSADAHAPAHLLAEGTAKLVTSGLRAVPHVAARMFADDNALDAFLQRLSEAGASEIFAIAGDVRHPAGVLTSSLELLDGPLLRKHGVVEIGIAGYPEGHPEIPEKLLEQSLEEKIRAAEERGIRVHIATQFSFHAPAIVKWIEGLRHRGIRSSVKIGIPGPSKASTLLAYAAACGVVTSAMQLRQDRTTTEERIWTPATLLDQLAEECSRRDLGQMGLNFFAFGGLRACARWLLDPALSHAGSALLKRAD